MSTSVLQAVFVKHKQVKITKCLKLNIFVIQLYKNIVLQIFFGGGLNIIFPNLIYTYFFKCLFCNVYIGFLFNNIIIFKKVCSHKKYEQFFSTHIISRQSIKNMRCFGKVKISIIAYCRYFFHSFFLFLFTLSLLTFVFINLVKVLLFKHL